MTLLAEVVCSFCPSVLRFAPETRATVLDFNMAGKVDHEMQQFILAEKEKVKFQSLVRSLTDECWEKCVEKIGSKLDSKTETCIVNCVERFLDTSNYVANRLTHMGEN